MIRNDRIYVPDGAASEADSRWYLSDEGLLLYSLADETVEIQPSSTAYTRNGVVTDVGYEIFFVEEGTAYISVDFMESFAGVKEAAFRQMKRKEFRQGCIWTATGEPMNRRRQPEKRLCGFWRGSKVRS